MDETGERWSRDRRMNFEWELLQELESNNSSRIRNVRRNRNDFELTLLGVPALDLERSEAGEFHIVTEHSLSIVFPRFYPAMPSEIVLRRPAFHPNIHPETGFICVWLNHKVEHTTEHALRKTMAILGWQLFNIVEAQVMQRRAGQLAASEAYCARVKSILAAPQLEPSRHWIQNLSEGIRRRRLS